MQITDEPAGFLRALLRCVLAVASISLRCTSYRIRSIRIGIR